ncbi:hypothetical protein AAHA92_25233 [Salvia divinorum]|uniref:Uncharacterized protein n=1 Tax=Salvia divinorum TaxID=28513 RepID=A0ABD1GCK4_SALDI
MRSPLQSHRRRRHSSLVTAAATPAQPSPSPLKPRRRDMSPSSCRRCFPLPVLHTARVFPDTKKNFGHKLVVRIGVELCRLCRPDVLRSENGKYTTKKAADIDAKVKEIAARQESSDQCSWGVNL